MSLRLPESLHAQLREMARKEGVSVNQYILMSVTERMARSEDYFAVRAARASAEKFDAALALVPSGEPVAGDELP
ncbi:toxin-antitoxin system HicB family antitoxin [Deinococcus lacus]|uniref:Toxin-antitoxin system HicB family antitoxin n=1 Tax=Deinococcus lacus TaxID=392561 RepID=A0ABW1YDL7_9DEIO